MRQGERSRQWTAKSAGEVGWLNGRSKTSPVGQVRRRGGFLGGGEGEKRKSEGSAVAGETAFNALLCWIGYSLRLWPSLE